MSGKTNKSPTSSHLAGDKGEEGKNPSTDSSTKTFYK